MRHLILKTKPLPKWSKKLSYLKKNEIFSIYDLEEKFKIKYNNIRMFFNRIGLKPDLKINKKGRFISYYNSNSIIEKYKEWCDPRKVDG